MEPEWGPLRSPPAKRVWQAAAPRLAQALRERSRPLSEAMLDRIGAEMPELVADPDDAETNRASNEANLHAIADLLERGANPGTVELPAQTIAYAEVGAHQGAPMAGLMRAYRIGHGFGWREMLAIMREQIDDPEQFATAVDLVSAWLHEYVDFAVCLAEQAYEEERERWLRTSAAVRTETIEAALGGASIEPALASARLGYELERWHVALVGWVDEGDSGSDALDGIESALRAAGSTLPGRPLIHPIGLRTALAWFGSLAAPADEWWPEGEDLGGVRIAIGGPAPGVDGFRNAYGEAMEARRIAILGDRRRLVTRYRDVALIALATADSEQAERFMRRELGPLADAGETSLRLAETLRAFLDEGASHGRAAARLEIHENTVRYRVRQAEDLLGRPVLPADLDLRVALELLDSISPAAIDGSTP